MASLTNDRPVPLREVRGIVDLSRGRTKKAYANKTYEAERGYWAGLPIDHLARRHTTIEEAQAVVDRYVADCRVSRGNGLWNGCYYRTQNRISIGGLASAWIVLHEIAHALSVDRGHGAGFRAAYVKVVRAEYGDEIADGLLEKFGSLNLKVA